MPTFQYKAIDASGKAVTGTLEATDRKAVVRELRRSRCKPVRISMTSSGTSSRSMAAPSDTEDIVVEKPVAKRFRSKSADATSLAFLKKVYQLHKSGMPIGDTIKNLSTRLTDPQLQGLASNIWREISEGKPMAAAIRQYPQTFDPSISYVIEAGEATGNLLPVLKDVIKQLETRIALRKKIIEGLSYPIVLCVMAMGVVAMLMFFLIPKIEDMMKKMGKGELPLPAQIINAFSEFLITQGPFVALGIVVAVMLTFQWRKTDKGRLETDKWLLRFPFVNGIALNIEICRICNILPTLLSSGVNATEALRLTGKSIQNTQILSKFQSARTMINDGATFLTAFKKYRFFSDMDLDILNVGENAGTPVESLKEIYEQHTAELDGQFKAMTIIIAGGALGFAFILIMMVVLSIVLTVLGMSQSVMTQ